MRYKYENQNINLLAKIALTLLKPVIIIWKENKGTKKKIIIREI